MSQQHEADSTSQHRWEHLSKEAAIDQAIYYKEKAKNLKKVLDYADLQIEELQSTNEILRGSNARLKQEVEENKSLKDSYMKLDDLYKQLIDDKLADK